MGQKIWRRWRHGPHTAIFQNLGGGGELGGVAYKDRAQTPPRGCGQRSAPWPAGSHNRDHTWSATALPIACQCTCSFKRTTCPCTGCPCTGCRKPNEFQQQQPKDYRDARAQSACKWADLGALTIRGQRVARRSWRGFLLVYICRRGFRSGGRQIQSPGEPQITIAGNEASVVEMLRKGSRRAGLP